MLSGPRPARPKMQSPEEYLDSLAISLSGGLITPELARAFIIFSSNNQQPVQSNPDQAGDTESEDN